MTRLVTLLRGINVGGNKLIPMAELKRLCGTLGYSDVETLLQSGNVVMSAEGKKAMTELALETSVEGSLERAIQKQFGFQVTVMARTSARWAAILKANPFSSVAEERPSLLLVGLSKEPLPKAAEKKALALLNEKAVLGERFKIQGGVLWADYSGGIGKSKVTPAWVDHAMGSPVTMRNWNTAGKIAEKIAVKIAEKK